MKKCYAKTRKQWRNWLERNHLKETHVSLIKFKRHTGKPALSHRESMEEAICFGWIDTTVKRIDEDTFERRFVRRNSKSRWSNATLSYARDMIKQDKMSEFGMKMYNEGRKKPTIDHGLPKNPKPPADLLDQLNKNKQALQFFTNLAPSYRRFFVYHIEKAKRPETRQKRIKEVYNKCKEGKKY